MTKRFRFRLPLAFACLFAVFPAFPETVRERAERHFSMTDWVVNPDMVPNAERPSVVVPGGQETFPVLSPVGDAGLVSVYPEIAGLGKIDYSALDPALISFLSRAGEGIQKHSLNQASCAPEKKFLAPILDYRLAKLPEISVVRFSRPVFPEIVGESKPAVIQDNPAVADPVAESAVSRDFSAATVMFRLDFEFDGKSKRPESLFLEASVSRKNDAWFIDDITLDGLTYAKLAQQN
jgi:hypothetical protein